jgi:hypothetical protein
MEGELRDFPLYDHLMISEDFFIQANQEVKQYDQKKYPTRMGF